MPSFTQCIRSSLLIIFTYNRGLKCFFVDRAKLDDNAKLSDFTDKLEAACIGVVESGKMTKDLALIIHGSKYVTCHCCVVSTFTNCICFSTVYD